MPHHHGFLHHFAHHLDRAFEVEAFARSHIQLQSDGVQGFLTMHRQVRALGQVLADQSIDVLIAAALPGAVRVAEVDRHPGPLGDLGVPRHLPALVVGHALAHRQRHAIERRTEALQRRGRRRVGHLDQHQVAAGTLHQGAHRRGIGLALDQVALPMAWHQPVFDLRRAHVDAEHFRDLAAPIDAARARPATRLALAQADDQLLAQATDRQGVDRVIDRLAADVGLSEAGYVHAAQLAGNLLGRQTLTQHMDDQLEALTARQQLALRPADLAADLHLLLGSTGLVAGARGPVAAQLPADGRGGAAEHPGNSPLAETLGKAELKGRTFGDTEFVIGHSGSTVPERSGVALSFCGRLASISSDPISMKEQAECYDFVKRKQVEIAKTKQAIHSLVLDIADSDAFVNGLKEKVNNLRDSAVVARNLEEIKFHSCPACFSILDSEEDALTYACHLCKTPYDSEQVAARIAGLVNESAVQIKQSEVLQGRRREKLLKLEEDLESLGKEWKSSAQKLSSMLGRPSTENQQLLRELQRRLGYIDRMIEDFDQKSKMAGVISSLSQRKTELQLRIISLGEENLGLRRAQQDRLNRAYLLISEEVKHLLHNDLRRQDSFENAKGLSFSFEKNRLTVDGESYFSASSRAILKSSFFAGFTAAASEEEFFRHPRFCMIDTLENMGVEEVRSQNFQRLLVNRSAKLKARHQIIYATAMIDPELNNASYTVGRYSTRDEPTIELWK